MIFFVIILWGNVWGNVKMDGWVIFVIKVSKLKKKDILKL